MKKKNTIFILIIFVVLIIFILITFNKKDYKQINIDLTKVENYTNSLSWELKENKYYGVYTVDYDSNMGIYGVNSTAGCTIMDINNEKMESEKHRLETNFAFDVDEFIYYEIDEEKNLLVLVEIENKYYFYKMDKKGKVDLKIKFDNRICSSFYIKEDNIYFLSREKQNANFFIEKYSYPYGDFIGENEFNNNSNIEMIGGIIFSLDEDKIKIFDFEANLSKTLQIPGDRESDEKFSSNNGDLYYLNSNGIYCLGENQEEFKKIFKAKYSKYFFGDYHIESFFVDSKDVIYFIVIDGTDIEFATILSIYDLSSDNH